MATPPPPPLPSDWAALPHQQRLDASIESYVAHGSARPAVGHLVRLARLVAYVGGGVVIASCTDGIGSPLQLASWWSEPIVLEKLVVWTLLWQLLGLGRGLAPYAVGALPPVAGLSYWLTPGTIRLAPFPDRVPLTAGTRRTPVDVVLYALVLAISAGLLGFTGVAGGVLPPAGVWALLGAGVLLGLRDRTPVLAARVEIVVPLLLVFQLPPGDVVVGLKLVLATLGWVGVVVAANRHLPFAVAATLADAPWLRSVRLRQRLWHRDDHDLVPADACRYLANLLVAIALTLPALLLFARGGTLTAVALGVTFAMLAASATIFSRVGQLELAAFLGYACAAVFGSYGDVGFRTLTEVGPVAALAVGLLLLIVAAAAFPSVSAVLSPWRHAAGSGPVSLWLVRADAADRLDVPVFTDCTEARHYRDLARLNLHPNGRALDGLLRRAVDDPACYLVRSAEFVAGAAVGWSIDSGDGVDRHLLAALQERCDFAPGQLRLLTLAAHSTLRTDYRYRLHDAATGLVEAGFVDIDDMVDRVPWRDPAAPSIPVEVQFSQAGCTGWTAPAAYDMFRPPALGPVADLADVRSMVVPALHRPAPHRPQPTRRVSRPTPAPPAVAAPVDARRPSPVARH